MYFILRLWSKFIQLDISRKHHPEEFFDFVCYFFDSLALIPIYVLLQLKRNVILETINQIQLKFQQNCFQIQEDSKKYEVYAKLKQSGSKVQYVKTYILYAIHIY